MTTPRPHGWLAWLCGVTVVASLATFALLAFLPQSRVTYKPSHPAKQEHVTYDPSHSQKYQIASITVIRPELLRYIGHCGLIGGFSLVLLAAISFYRGSYNLTAILIPTVALGPLALLVSFLCHPTPWQIHNEIRGPDGTTYGFAGSSCLQSNEVLLVRVREESRWTRTADALVRTEGGSPRRYLQIVRPTGAENTYGQLYLTDDGWLLGLRSENRCCFAYDTRAERPYGYHDVEALSPFLALDAGAELHEPDVADVTTKLGQNNVVGLPSADEVRKGLYHPNPHVRAVAAVWLKRMQ